MADNASTVRMLYQAFNDKDLDRLASYCASDAEAESVPFHFRQKVRNYFAGWASAFPDGRTEITRLIAAGKLVTVEFTGRGTHRGNLSTPSGMLTPSNRYVEGRFVDVYEFDDAGKVVSMSSYFDSADLLRQLGILPTLQPPQQAVEEQPGMH